MLVADWASSTTSSLSNRMHAGSRRRPDGERAVAPLLSLASGLIHFIWPGARPAATRRLRWACAPDTPPRLRAQTPVQGRSDSFQISASSNGQYYGSSSFFT